jgi:integrase
VPTAVFGICLHFSNRDRVSAVALEFTILTAARTPEVIGARWSEIDLDAGVWTVSAERMKGSKEHQVPLSKRAIALLEDLSRERGGFVFVGARAKAPLSIWRCLSCCVA